MEENRRSKSLARFEPKSRLKLHIAKKPSLTLETEAAQMSPGKITIQQFDFKAHLQFLPRKRLSEKLPKSLQSPTLASYRSPLQSSLASVRRRALTRIESLDFLTIKSKSDGEKPIHMDFPTSARLITTLAMRKKMFNIEKTTARGGGFTTYGLMYQNTPRRVPFLISKKEHGQRSTKRHSKIRLSLDASKPAEVVRPSA